MMKSIRALIGNNLCPPYMRLHKFFMSGKQVVLCFFTNFGKLNDAPDPQLYALIDAFCLQKGNYTCDERIHYSVIGLIFFVRICHEELACPTTIKLFDQLWITH